MLPPRSDDPPIGGGTLLVAIGVSLAVACVLSQCLVNPSKLDDRIVGFNVAVFLLISGIIVAEGYQLTRRDLDPVRQYRVVGWAGAGAIGLASMATWIIIEQWWLGTVLRGVDYLILVSIATGCAIGGYAGLQTQSVDSFVEELEDQQNAFRFLNRTLRHHVLNGMQLIQAHGEILSERLGPDSAEDVDVIRQQVKRVSSLVTSLRVISNTIAGDNEYQPVDLGSLVEGELVELRQRYPHVDVEASIDEAVAVRANSGLRYVVKHLLENAVVHNDAPDPVVTVRIEARVGFGRFEVADNGPGIPAEERAALFEPGEYGDDGLGLFLVQTLVDAYDGVLELEDSVEGGTRIRVDVPTVA